MALLTSDLVSHWKLKEAGTATRVDSFGTNDCPVTLGSVPSATGKIGMAASFNGSTSNRMRIDAPAANLALGADIKMAMTAWIKVNNLSVLRRIACNYISVGNKRVFAFSVNTNGTIEISGRNVGDTAWFILTSTATVSVGVWHFVAWWYDGANLGVRVDTTEKTMTALGDMLGGSGVGYDFAIGSYNVTGQLPMDGDVDELSIFRKQVIGPERILTSAQMDTLYNGGNGLAFESWDAAAAGRRGLMLPEIHGRMLL